MSIKSDKWITRMSQEHGMIEQFQGKQVRQPDPNGQKVISYGVSSYGYDVRCADEFKIFTNIHSKTVDPKHFDEDAFIDVKGDYCIIPPNSFALARTIEYFRIPRRVLTVCLGKSTYARCGIIVNVTPLEPEWKGMLLSSFLTPLASPLRFTLTKVWLRCCSSSPMKSVKCLTLTVAVSIRARLALRSPKHKPMIKLKITL